MTTTKVIALFAIVFAIFMLYMNAQGKAVPLMESIVAPPESTGFTPTTANDIGKFLLAIIIFIIALSFLTPRNGFYLTLILVLGALMINSKNMGADSVLSVLFGAQPMQKQTGLPSGGQPQTFPGT